MRIVIALVVAAGCATDADVSPESPSTIGAGTVTKATWSGGDCAHDWTCACAITFSTAHISARFAGGTLAATGDLSSDAYTHMRELVSLIPSDAPTGYLPEGTDGPGVSELWIDTSDALRVYVSNGFTGDLGLYIYELRDAIATCSSTMTTFTTCTP
jgi:hypothetical protein